MLAVERVDHLDVDLRALERRVVEAANIVEEVAAQRAVGVDGRALEAEVVVVLGNLLVDRRVVDGDRDRQGQRPVHALLQVEEAAVDLFEIGGGNFIVGGGDELNADVCQRQRRIAVVGDDDTHRDEAVLNIRQAKKVALVRIVAGVDADGDVLVGMRVEGRILVRGLDWRSLVAGSERRGGEDAGGGDDSQSL